MHADSSSPAPLSGPSTTLVWRAGLALAVLTLVGLFWGLPYQQWDFGYRTSVLNGWMKWVIEKADWNFCLVVPVITGALIWLRRAELRAQPWKGDWLGLPVLAAGLFVYWVGYKADTGYPGFLAVQLLFAGLVLLIAGRGWMRTLFFAWLFLFFTWPMQPLEDSVASPLRPRTAAITARILSLFGMPSVSEGSALQSAADAERGLALGDRFSLDIDAKCSGINSLFALMMISALLGYLALKSPKSRLVLFVSAIPLAVLGNIARLVMLAYGSVWFGADFAVGKRIGEHQEMSLYHTCAGFAVFGVALAGMFALCWLLEGREMGANLKRHQKTRASATGAIAVANPRRTWMQIASATALILVTAGICLATDTRYLVSRAGVNLDLPLEVAGYQGRPMEVTAFEKDKLEEGVKLSRMAYLNEKGRQIICSVILSGKGKRNLHRPEVCLPGQGWTIVESSPVTVPLAGESALKATMLRIFVDRSTPDGRRERVRGVNIYWYVGSDDTTCASHYEHVLKSYAHAIFRNVNHRWAMISVFIPVVEQASSDPLAVSESMFAEFSAIEDAQSFAGQFLPKVLLPPDAAE